jgi:hypothetical protein
MALFDTVQHTRVCSSKLIGAETFKKLMEWLVIYEFSRGVIYRVSDRQTVQNHLETYWAKYPFHRNFCTW